MSEKMQQFASDNYSGICPEALDYTSRANQRHEIAYGNDGWTTKVSDRLRELFEIDCEVYFVFNGTAANSLALSALCQSYHSIICHNLAHVETDECGAPEFFSNGSKILLGSGENGKLNPAAIEQLVKKRSDIHYPKPKVVTLTQATEVGTVYTKDELLEIRNVADKHALKIHMDGARFANAVAQLDVKPKEITWQCGVDVLCFGGTKNGLAVGEVIIFFNKQQAADFDYRCKQAGQLASKMRFLSAPWLGLLEDDVWLNNARNANQRAASLERQLVGLSGLRLMFPRQANSVFVEMPPHVIDFLHAQGWHFYTFIGAGGARFMCSWDTTEASVQALVADIKAAL
jgi:threonine aldolase